jgi:hypothetical protein
MSGAPGLAAQNGLGAWLIGHASSSSKRSRVSRSLRVRGVGGGRATANSPPLAQLRLASQVTGWGRIRALAREGACGEQ